MQTEALLLGGGRLRWWVHDGVDSMRLCAMRLDWTGLGWNGSDWVALDLSGNVYVYASVSF